MENGKTPEWVEQILKNQQALTDVVVSMNNRLLAVETKKSEEEESPADDEELPDYTQEEMDAMFGNVKL